MALVDYNFKELRTYFNRKQLDYTLIETNLENNTVTLCNKLEYIMLHYLLHMKVPKIGEILFVELRQLSTILTLPCEKHKRIDPNTFQ